MKVGNLNVLFLRKCVKFLCIFVFSVYCLIWMMSPVILRYTINAHALPSHLQLTSDTSIRYNPFLSSLTIDSLFIKDEQDKTQLSIEHLALQIHLYQFLFDKVYIADFVVDGVAINIHADAQQMQIAGFKLANSTPNNEEVAQEPTHENNNAAVHYEVILPQVKLSDINLVIEHLNQEHRYHVNVLSLQDSVLSQTQQKINLEVESHLNDASVDIKLSTTLENNAGNIELAINAKDIGLTAIKPYLDPNISAIDGKVSITAKHQIDLANDLTHISVNDLSLLLKDFHVTQNEISLDISEQRLSGDNLDITLTDTASVTVVANLTYLMDTLVAKKQSALLAGINKVAVDGITLNVMDNIPTVDINTIHIAKGEFSKVDSAETPAIAMFNAIDLKAFNFTTNKITLEEVTLAGFNSSVILNEDKAVANLIHLASDNGLANANVENKGDVEQKEPTEQQEINSEEESPMQFSLARFSLVDDAKVYFKDASVQPVYERNFTIETLDVEQVTNIDVNQNAQINIAGVSDTYTRFNMAAKGQFFAQEKQAEMTTKVTELSLPGVSSYIKGALGYEIESGQLDLDVKGQIVGNDLDANVDLLLRGIDFTAADDHEAKTITDQTSIPFNVALGMLKDSDGNVTLSVPVSGDINDPSIGMSGFLSLLVKQATMSAAKDYLIATFVPYANVMKVAMAAGEFALKLRINDLEYMPTEVVLNTEQLEFSRQMAVMLADRADVNVKLCAIATASDLKLANAKDAALAENVKKLAQLSLQRIDNLKQHLVNNLAVPSARLLLCTPQIDTGDEAKPRIEFKI